jgi:catechol 2,3-dioxygenase-like lactoylglutathione lyase family enzyme
MTDPRAHHVGVTVSDLDRCTEFYRDVLGFDVVDRFSVGGESFAAAVGVDGASGRFVHLSADGLRPSSTRGSRDDARGVRVELVEYDPAGDDLPTASVDRAGATHLGFAVDDVDAFYEDLPDDVETLSAPKTTESGTRICFLRDPEGNLVELLEA